ncbi:MAG TPA: universal stress protein UspA [Acidimicrobiaceae bacterium]|nr:universal stress protein UspA [Acidimicrobiaceae bacterium]
MQDAAQVVGTIVVGLDGSSNSHEAVVWAARLARSLDAEVVAVHALGLLDQLEPGGPMVPTQPHRDEIAERANGLWSRPLEEAGVRHRVLLHDGNPVDVVLNVLDEVGADLAVLGSRGIGGTPALLLGSTSSQVAQRALCPVTIVPPSDRPTEGRSR